MAILTRETIKDEKGNQLHFSADDSLYIIKAMEEFMLCYRIAGHLKSIIFPDKLEPKQPDNLGFNNHKPGTLKFEFQFRGFLPRHVMPMFSVENHQYIQDQLVWQNGAIFQLEDHHVLARVQVDYHDRVLKIWVQPEKSGQNSGVNDVLVIFRHGVKTILKCMDKLEYDEKVVLPRPALISGAAAGVDVGEEKASYHQLIEHARDGKTEFIADSGSKYDVRRVMDIIMPQKKQQAAGITYHINGNVGAISTGDPSGSVTGTVNITHGLSASDVQQLVGAIDGLIKDVFECQAETTEKMAAVEALTQLKTLATKPGDLSKEEAQQAKSILVKLKEGSLKALDMAKGVKNHAEPIAWIIKTLGG